MDYEKELGKFSFGFGTQKTAGKGKLKDAFVVKDSKADRKMLVNAAVKGAAAVGILMLSHSMKKRKK